MASGSRARIFFFSHAQINLATYTHVVYATRMQVQKAFKYRFYPTPDQAEELKHIFGCTRFVYNWALGVRKEAYEEDETKVSFSETSSMLTQLKREAEYTWLNDVARCTIEQSLRQLDTAYSAFFKKRARYPKFKKKGRAKESSTFSGKKTFKYVPADDTKDGQLTLSRMNEPLNIRWSRELPSMPSRVTVSKDQAGRYFISILCKDEIKLFPELKNEVGIDLGIDSVVVTDDGWKSGNPKHFAKHERRLATEQRRLAKKKPGSKNREKQKLKVAKRYAKIADCRRDFTNKLTTKLIKEYGFIHMESLNIKEMVGKEI